MTESYRTIRKEINLTLEEFEQIQLLMRKENAEQFSPLLDKNYWTLSITRMTSEIGLFCGNLKK